MADTYKFPGGGYDVTVFKKQDVLDCIDKNILDKDSFVFSFIFFWLFVMRVSFVVLAERLSEDTIFVLLLRSIERSSVLPLLLRCLF